MLSQLLVLSMAFFSWEALAQTPPAPPSSAPKKKVRFSSASPSKTKLRPLSSSASSSTSSKNKRKARPFTLSPEEEAELRSILTKAGWSEKTTAQILSTEDHGLPSRVGAFPVPAQIAPRVRFWYRIFGVLAANEVAIYDTQELMLLARVASPGAELLPTDTPAQRREKTQRRIRATQLEMKPLQARLRALAKVEAHAEAIERTHWRQKRSLCSSIQSRKPRMVCNARLSFDPLRIDRARWQAAFATLPAETRSLLAAIQRNPRWQAPGWHQVLRRLSKTRLSWQSSYKGFFAHGLTIQRIYSKHIASILQKEGLPKELAALPFVESMYNPWVRSVVGALGLWQLMPDTAREMGLYVAPTAKTSQAPVIDERQDPLHATRAAVRFVKLCRHFFPSSWPLAITSYNQGPGRILKEAKRLNTKHLHDIIQRSKGAGFGFDGQNFYSKFVASALLMRDQKKRFGGSPSSSLAFQVVRFDHPIWLTEIAKALHLSPGQLLTYNPVLKPVLSDAMTQIPAHFPIRLPKSAFHKHKKAFEAITKQGGSFLVYTSKKGDTFAKIASRYQIPLAALLQKNASLLSSPLSTESKKACRTKHISRKKLRPSARCSSPSPYRSLPLGSRVFLPTVRLAPGRLTSYRAKGGEPLSWVACQACTTVWHIRSLNPALPIGRLRPGQTLRVPTCAKGLRSSFARCYLHHYRSGGGAKKGKKSTKGKKSRKKSKARGYVRKSSKRRSRLARR